jgi:hypothetical protein
MTKLTVAFSNFVNTRKNVQKTRLCAQVAKKTRCSISRESKDFCFSSDNPVQSTAAAAFSSDNPVQSTAAASINIDYDITP